MKLISLLIKPKIFFFYLKNIMSLSKSKFKEDLNECLNELNKNLNFPDLVVYENFSDLINEVDLAFETKKYENDYGDFRIDEFNNKWSEIIDEIKTMKISNEKNFKQTYSTEYFTDETKISVNKLLETLTTRVNDELNENSYQEIKSIISREIIRLQTILFSKKSILFIDKSKCEDQRLLRQKDFKMIVISDEFISKNGVQLLKKKYFRDFYYIIINI